MSVRLREIVHLLASHYSPAWAVPGDRTGLEVGHPEAEVVRILVALEVTPAVIKEAQVRGAQLLLTHHPLLYRPLETVREDQPGGRLLSELIRAGLALVSCHTNLDVAPGGLNDYLAARLELTGVEVLSVTTRDTCYKLVVFVPVSHEERVRQALGDAGLGLIGRYSHCSFAARGQGTYLPLAGARPFRGETDQLSRVEESRLELLAPESLLPVALTRLRETHPYEEIAYDLYPLRHGGAPLGLGRIGRWPEPRDFSRVISRIKEVFRVAKVRVWGEPPTQVQRVAVCGGSGGDLIPEAREQGAQIYLTGEVRHHQVPPGELEHFAILEVGHFASEVVFMESWAEKLRQLLHAAGLGLEVLLTREHSPPCGYV